MSGIGSARNPFRWLSFPVKVSAVPPTAPGRLIAGLALLVLLSACAGPGTQAGARPTPSAPTGSASPAESATVAPTTAPPPSTAPTTAPTASGGSPSSAVACSGPIPSGDNLVLGTLTGSASVVLRDITNLSSPRNLCTFVGSIAPRFATASVVGYTEQGSDLGSPGHITRLDLAAASATNLASWTTGGFGSGLFDWSPDGSALTYLGPGSPGPVWHLLSGGRDQVLATLPAVLGRGVSLEDDDFMVAFSPDGLYLALVETFATGGTGDSSPLQVRRASDGGLVYSAASGTMAVWASVPSRLFFRSAAGVLSRWDPSSGVSVLQSSLRWTRPHASPDGRWVAYTSYDSARHPHVSLYSVQGNSLRAVVSGLRSGAQFLNNNLLWYQEEAACDCGLATSQTTGTAYLYDIAANAESGSRLSGVFDAWPRVTAPPGF